MLATIAQIKGALTAAGFDLRGSFYDRRTWTDRRKAKGAAENERNFTVKFASGREADAAAAVLRELYELAGVKATVKRTTVESDWATHRSGGEYVRTVAVL